MGVDIFSWGGGGGGGGGVAYVSMPNSVTTPIYVAVVLQ